MRRATIGVAVVGAVLWLSLGSASGANIGIHTLRDWERALNPMMGVPMYPMVVPVPFEVFREMVDRDEQWNTPVELTKDGQPYLFNYRESLLFTPTLEAMAHEDGGPPGVPGGPAGALQGRTEPALVMRWGDPNQGEGDPNSLPAPPRVGAAWDLVFGGPNDPGQDFTSGDGILEYSVHGPAESMIVSVNMVDVNENYREWWWHVGFDPGDIPPCEWTDIWVDPVSGASSHNPVMYFDGGGGAFDLSAIQYIRFNENGIWSEEFWDPATGLVWNAWDHVETTPEPVTLLSVTAGLCAFGAYVRRRRRA